MVQIPVAFGPADSMIVRDVALINNCDATANRRLHSFWLIIAAIGLAGGICSAVA
jgi:hypothetical protein